MEIRQLRTLVSILDFGGFASAGEALGLTQSAISLQIKGLEQEFGEKLFDRSKRPPIPTLRAIDLAQKSREILRLCNDLNSSANLLFSGSIQIGTIGSIQRILLPKALNSLRKKTTDLFINVHTGPSGELINNVHRGILDAAIVTEPHKLPMGLEFHPIVLKSLVVIYDKKAKGKTPKEILESNPYIQFKKSTMAGELIESEFKRLGIKVNAVLETDNIDSIWQIVSSGMGVSIMPQYLTYMDVENTEKEGGGHSSRLSPEDTKLLDKLIPPNVKIMSLNENSVKLSIGLVRRSVDPKKHLIDILQESLKGQ